MSSSGSGELKREGKREDAKRDEVKREEEGVDTKPQPIVQAEELT
ncbi:MscS mechanosensitive ion channel [Mycobacteroides abscessus subsp. abscessus]|nr:MscS mechanosensitive ion channel [Mycobacteroides abscessus subsp. abscessus]